jgi:hypothetical protein
MIGGVVLAPLMCALAALQQDPFQDLQERRPPPAPRQEAPGFFDENFTLKKELYAQITSSTQEPKPDDPFVENVYLRESVGLEILKKFSTATSTLASIDFQGRLVWRNNFIETINDMEGLHRDGWTFEYHNFYADLYNILNPFLGDQAQADALGKVNFRVGHFYVPFGLNLQTDTHGTLLQLSNDRNFGFERDWYAGFWGSITPDFSYDVYYMLGSGYPIAFRGQLGMIGPRLSLSNRWRNEIGLEAGISFLRGERLSQDAAQRSPTVAATAEDGRVVDTLRVGLDARYTLPTSLGSFSATMELSAGRDEHDDLYTQLYQLDYLALDRQWGCSVQYRRFWQDLSGTGMNNADASLVSEIAWYFRNDLTGAYLHSLRLNVEVQLERQMGPRATIVSVQYYFYW